MPSLTGFLGWLQADEVEVKRQMDAAGGRIRVMTVHGAKGLEAPIVILPETQDRKPPEGDEIVPLDDGRAGLAGPGGRKPGGDAAAVAAPARQGRGGKPAAALCGADAGAGLADRRGGGRSDEAGLLVQHRPRRDGPAQERVPLDDGMLRLAHGTWPAPAAVAAPHGWR